MKLQVESCGLQVLRRGSPPRATFNLHRAFSLIEIMVVMSLLSLIVLALMEVFSSTQRAFRASATQSDVLEGGRAAVELITSDLRQMAPSGGASNNFTYVSPVNFFYSAPVNFFAVDNNYYIINNSYPALSYTPLLQSLPGGSVQRTNVLNYFFLLGRNNTTWFGTGYAVNSTSVSPLYPLYRFYATTNLSTSPLTLLNLFLLEIRNAQWTNMSHIMDGVVHLVVRPNDINGYSMTGTYPSEFGSTNNNVLFYPPFNGTVGSCFFSNTVPASVELEMGVLEDRTLQRAESRPASQQAAYLSDKSGNVHIFRQRVTIQNVDPTAYQ